MGKKWVKVSATEIKVGDRVRQVDKTSEYRQTVSGVVTYVTPADIDLGGSSFSPSIGTWYVRKPKPAKPAADRYDGHGVEYWYNRYARQLAHSEQLQAANKNRRQKMQLLKKKAEDARRDVDGWAMRYAALAASINELPDEPTPPAPLTRPDEPPVGTFFRVDRTGCEWERPFRDPKDYELAISPGPRYRVVGESGAYYAWEKVVEPGDTITALQLVEVGDKRDELFEATEKIAELERSLMDLSGGEW